MFHLKLGTKLLNVLLSIGPVLDTNARARAHTHTHPFIVKVSA